MSWDILVWAAGAPPPPVSEMPDDWSGDSMGSLEEVRTKISHVFPETDWSEANWGTVRESGASLNFNIGEDDPCMDFAIHVYGGGDPTPQIAELLSRTGWFAIDTGQGEWLHHARPLRKGWDRFRAYRDRVFGR